ncbi:MAG TPA: type II toxin-antitoxin system VapB family antitoxin [Solirubrobacterales bacterium]|nr:type II toxin-antitoxin system VapB family antitoxin [Solirubrobacterales bacterium]
MALNIENEETQKLATEIAKLTGESEEEAVRHALREKRDRLPLRKGRKPKTLDEALLYMETEIWPFIPDRGGPPMTKAERAKLLGYGPDDD